MDKLEEKFYEIAASEIATKDVAPGVMAKALVMADGDEKKAVAHYIRLRVEQLDADYLAAEAQRAEEHEKRRKEEEKERARQRKLEEADKMEKRNSRWTICPECGFRGNMRDSYLPRLDHDLFVPSVRCPECGNRFDWHYVPE